MGELNISKLCGRRSTLNGKRDQRPNCPSGSVNDQAKRLENQNLLKMMKKEVPKPSRSRRRRRGRGRNHSSCTLPHHPTKLDGKNSEIFSEFYSIFLSDIYISSIKNNMKKWEQSTTTLKHRKI